jgi:V8-like Glu-specific endopeptidase
LTTRWAGSLPPEVVKAAESVVAALDGKAPSGSNVAMPEPTSPGMSTSGSPNPPNEVIPVMSDKSAPVPVTGHSNLLLFGPNATECSRFQGCGCLVDAKGNYFASGVVIGKHVVLTAKHCLKNRVTGQPVDRVLIGAKRADEGDATMLWKVLEKIQNPDTDLLILIVESDPLASPAAISLQKEAFELASPVEIEGQREFTMVGFGADNPSNGGGFGVKREVVLQKNQLLDFEFSAGVSNYADTAQGDSGGPALIQVGNKYKLAGITSRAAKPPYGGIYVRVDRHWDWINKILAQNT